MLKLFSYRQSKVRYSYGFNYQIGCEELLEETEVVLGIKLRCWHMVSGVHS